MISTRPCKILCESALSALPWHFYPRVSNHILHPMHFIIFPLQTNIASLQNSPRTLPPTCPSCVPEPRTPALPPSRFSPFSVLKSCQFQSPNSSRGDPSANHYPTCQWPMSHCTHLYPAQGFWHNTIPSCINDKVQCLGWKRTSFMKLS